MIFRSRFLPTPAEFLSVVSMCMALFTAVFGVATAPAQEGPEPLPIEATASGEDREEAEVEAQESDSFLSVPGDIQVNSLETTYDSVTGMINAVGEVHIIYRGVEIFANTADYDIATGDIFVKDKISIFKGGLVYKGDSAVYNINTEEVTADNIRSGLGPILYDAGTMKANTSDLDVITTAETMFTTHDNAHPNFYIRARTIDIYPEDKIVFRNLKVYAGGRQVLWLPYLVQPFNDELGYSFTPGYTSFWGAFLLNQYGFLIGDHTLAQAKFDLRSDRGLAGGIDFFSQRHKQNENFGKLQLYYAKDSNPEESFNNLKRPTISDNRYRITFQHRIYLPGPEESDLYIDFDVNKFSDEFMLEDFYPGEFRVNPRPDNIVNLVKRGPRSQFSLWTRFNANSFFLTDSRLPEIAVDFTRQPIFDTGFFYEGQTSFGFYKEQVEDFAQLQLETAIDNANQLIRNADRFRDPGSLLFNPAFNETETRSVLDALRVAVSDNQFTRFNTYHQILYPFLLKDCLSVVPRAGVSLTNYTGVSGGFVNTSETRTLGQAGLEASIKFSKLYPGIHKPKLGVDEFRHIFQPYLDYSYLAGNDLPQGFPLIDRYAPTTQLRPINIPQFTAIDELRNWNILKVGMRNRLQTKRDRGTHNWLELDTYFQVFFEDPEFDRDFSNLYNVLGIYPLPWLRLEIDSQLPVFSDPFEYTEVNSRVSFQPWKHTEFRIGHRLLNDHPLFEDSSLLTLYTYTRLSENWGFSMDHRYELDDSVWEMQRYSLHRDLNSWTAAIGAMILDNRGVNEYGFIFSLSLKEFPRVSIPLSIIPGSESR